MRAILLLLCLAAPAAAQDVQPAPGGPPRTLAYTVVADSISGAKLPRLTDTRDPRAREVNRQLDSLSAELRCLDKVDPFGNATEHWSDARVDYAADDILSVHIRFGGFCGGAHPINGINLSVTYDLRTGEAVPFRKLFTSWQRDAVPIVRALFPAQAAVAERVQAEGVEPDGESDEFCWQFYGAKELARGDFAYTLSDSGLVVEPEFPHVITACREVALVPYERLRPFAAPGGILERMAVRRTGKRD